MMSQYRSLLTSGGIVLVGSMVVNILNYGFNLIISRLLTPAQFGEVATLFGLLTIVSVPGVVLITLIAKYTAHYHANQRFQHIAVLYRELRRYAILGGAVLLALFLLLNPLLVHSLRIEPLSLFLFSLAMPLSLIAALNTGTLQGLQRFISYSLTNLISAVAKIGVGVALVILGYQVAGVMLAMLISIAIAFLYGQIVVHRQFATHRRLQAPSPTIEPLNLKRQFIRLGTVVFLASLLTSMLNNIDMQGGIACKG